MSYQETTAQHNQNHKSPSHANGPNNPPQKQATRISTSYRRETATRTSLVDLPSGSKPSSGFSGGVGGAPHGDSPSTACSLVTADRQLDHCRPGPIRSQNRILSASEGRTGVGPLVENDGDRFRRPSSVSRRAAARRTLPPSTGTRKSGGPAATGPPDGAAAEDGRAPHQ